MRRTIAYLTIIAAGTLLLEPSVSLAGDDLVKASREAKARRERLRKERAKARDEAKVLNNDDLRKRAGRVSETGRSSSDPPAPVLAEPSGAKGDEALWREKMAEARTALDKAKEEVAETNIRINQLRRDQSAIQDPNIRYRKSQELLQEQAALVPRQQAVQAAERGIEGVREAARRAGVPPGWVR